jgi:hypothetical protein
MSAICPLCGTGGALIAAAGTFLCQSCGKEGAFAGDPLVDLQP